MKNRIPILQAKLNPPRLTGALNRNRLIDSLKEIVNKKMALVVAGAGYGKTTLVAQTIRQMDTLALWYCLDESDRDFTVFLNYLTAAIQRHRPDFGQEISTRLNASSFSPKFQETALRHFMADMQHQVTSHMVMVLDDYHRVQDSPDIAKAMELLLRLGPPTLHWILTSRTEPPLKTSRYRTMDDVIDIDEAGLTFTADEIDQLCAIRLPAPLKSSVHQLLHEKSRGWAAALILFLNAIRDRPSGDDSGKMAAIGPLPKDVFRYLEENVFEALPNQIQSFMMRSSLLERLEPAFCDSVFKRRDSRQILETLCRKHLLTFPCEGKVGVFFYHHLLRDFLSDRLERVFGLQHVRALHNEIGHAMETAGNILKSVEHYLKGEQTEAVCRILAGMSINDFIRFPLRFLSETFTHIPEKRVRREARLLYLKAKLDSLRGDVHIAIKGFQEALERFQAADDPMGVSDCLKDLGFHHYLTGDVVRAKTRMQTLWGQSHADPFFAAEVAGYLILFSAIQGSFKDADHYHESFPLPAAGSDPAYRELANCWLDLCYSNRLHHSGDFNQAANLNQRTLDGFVRMEMASFLPLANFQSALTSFFLGRHPEGHDFAERGLNLAATMGIFDHQYAWLLYARGLHAWRLDKTDQALMDAREAMAIFKGHTNYWGQACVYEMYSAIYRRHGKPEKAIECVETGWQLIDGLGLSTTQAALALRHAELMADAGNYAKALSVLHFNGNHIRTSMFNQFQSFLLYARIFKVLENDTQAIASMEKALQLGQANRYDAWVLQEPEWAIPLLVGCYGQERMQDYIKGIFRLAGSHGKTILGSLLNDPGTSIRATVRELMATLPKTAPSLHVRCLGTFGLAAGDRIIPKIQWRSAAALKIFKYLVIHQDQGYIAKDILMEHVWPDEDPDKTTRRFHVALNALRRLLEPGLKRGVASSYLIRHNDAYRLENGAGGTIDYKDFSPPWK